MTPIFSKYFYVTQLFFDQDQLSIIRLTGNFTDRTHTMFLPPQELKREEAINLIDAGVFVFTETKNNQRKLLKKVEVSGVTILRLVDDTFLNKGKRRSYNSEI